jgi:hypothetical protein
MLTQLRFIHKLKHKRHPWDDALVGACFHSGNKLGSTSQIRRMVIDGN